MATMTADGAFSADLKDYMDSIKDSLKQLLKQSKDQTVAAQSVVKNSNEKEVKEKVSSSKGETANTMNRSSDEMVGFTRASYDLIKSAIPDFKTMMKPGGLVKAVGLGLNSPALMMLGDSIDNVTNKIKEQMKQSYGESNGIRLSLKELGVKNDIIKQVMEQTKDLTSHDSSDIHKILIQNGVTNKAALDAIVEQKQKFEEGILFKNPELVESLRAQDKNDEEIIKQLRKSNQEGIWTEQENAEQRKSLKSISEFASEQSSSLKSLLGLTSSYMKEKLKSAGGIGLALLAILGMGVASFVSSFTKSLYTMYKPLFTASKWMFGKGGKLLKALFNIEIRFDKFGRMLARVYGPLGKVFNRFVGAFNKIRSVVTMFTTKASPIIGKFGGRMGTLFKVMTGKIRLFTKLIGIAGKIGNIVGKIIMPVMMVYKAIKGILNAKTIRDKILAASAGILSVVAEIPEMIINGLLKLFGSDMRVNFSSDAIIKAVNNVTQLVFDKITVPLLDFLTIKVPAYFDQIADLFNTVKEAFLNGLSILKDKATGAMEKIDVFGWFHDKKKGEEEPKPKPKTGPTNRSPYGNHAPKPVIDKQPDGSPAVRQVVTEQKITDAANAQKTGGQGGNNNTAVVNANTVNNIQSTDMTTKLDDPTWRPI